MFLEAVHGISAYAAGAARRAGLHDLADDVAQDVHVDLVDKPGYPDDYWRPNVRDAPRYDDLQRAVGRFLKRHQRARARTAPLPPDEIVAPSSDREQAVQTLQGVLSDAMHYLSDEEMQILQLKKEGYTFEEIAITMGMSLTTVYTMFRKAIKKIVQKICSLYEG